MSNNRKLKITLAAVAAVFAVSALTSETALARPAWYGPGSGPVSPYKTFKGFGQITRQPGSFGRGTPYTAPSSGTYHCVPNVGLVGPNGVCPD